ncbi:MAG: hypothetical protein KL840_07545 [Aquamicrobium sp.]|nr:hypothetical protein [Aquamicrobium sp.]
MFGAKFAVLCLVLVNWLGLGSIHANALEVRGSDDTRTVLIGNTKMLRSELVCPAGGMAGSGVDATLEWADLSYWDAASCVLENAETLTPAETVTWLKNMNLTINRVDFQIDGYPARVIGHTGGDLLRGSRPFYQKLIKVYGTSIKIDWDESRRIYRVSISSDTL